MNDFTQTVLLMRDAGAVHRSHTCRTLKDRNVAEHSHGVAMLVLLLYQACGCLPPARMLAAALVHDLSEIATGDMPAPVKVEHPDLKAMLNRISTAWEEQYGLRYTLSENEAHLLLWCDRMDFALFTFEEIEMGNTLFKPYLRIVTWLVNMPLPLIDDSIHVQMQNSARNLLNAVIEKAQNFGWRKP
jgi:5'-deoxynucleotidase YfbR-like HD superfamily hydrolase